MFNRASPQTYLAVWENYLLAKAYFSDDDCLQDAKAFVGGAQCAVRLREALRSMRVNLHRSFSTSNRMVLTDTVSRSVVTSIEIRLEMNSSLTSNPVVPAELHIQNAMLATEIRLECSDLYVNYCFTIGNMRQKL